MAGDGRKRDEGDAFPRAGREGRREEGGRGSGGRRGHGCVEECDDGFGVAETAALFGMEAVGEPLRPSQQAGLHLTQRVEPGVDGTDAVVFGEAFEFGDRGGRLAGEEIVEHLRAKRMHEDDVTIGGEQLAQQALASAVAAGGGLVEVIDRVFDEDEIAAVSEDVALAAEDGEVAAGGTDGRVFNGEPDIGIRGGEPGDERFGPARAGFGVGDGAAQKTDGEVAAGESSGGACKRPPHAQDRISDGGRGAHAGARRVRPRCQLKDLTRVVVGTPGSPRSLVSIMRIRTAAAMAPTLRESIWRPLSSRAGCSL